MCQGLFRRYTENNIERCVFIAPYGAVLCSYFNGKQPVAEKMKWFWSFERKRELMPLTWTRVQSTFIDYFNFLSLDTHLNSCWLRLQGKLKVLSLFLCLSFFLFKQHNCRVKGNPVKGYCYSIKTEVLKKISEWGTVRDNNKLSTSMWIHMSMWNSRRNPVFREEDWQAKNVN